MRYLLVAILSLFSLLPCPIAGWAQSATYDFKGGSFDLPTPRGFCIPGSSNEYDANFVKLKTAQLSNTGNRLVKLVAVCSQLRQRANPYDFIVYFYPTSTENESLKGTTQSLRKAACDDMRKAQPDQKVVSEANAKAARELKQNVVSGKIENLGVIAEDAHGCYVEFLLSTANSRGPFINDIHVLDTVIQGKTLIVSLNSKHQNPAESQKSLLFLQAIAAELDSKNLD